MEIFAIFPSWVLTTVLAIFMFNILLYILKSNRSSISAPKFPPNPPKLPIIGNLHQIVGKPRHEALWQLSQKYGPLMQLHIGSKPFIIVTSPSMAKQIYKTQDHVFCSRPNNYASKRITYNFLDVAFSPPTDRRQELRKILVSEFFGPKKAKFLNSVLETEIDSMVGSLLSNPSNTVVNLNKVMLATISGVVCKAGFGVNFREEPIKGVPWGKMLEESMDVLNGSFVDSFPWLGRVIDHFSGWNGRLERCFSDLDAYIEMVINEHRNRSAAPETNDKDFLQTILDISSGDTPSEYRLSKEDVKALVMDILTGGVDTTVVTAVWAMSEITRNPRVMRKLQNEIRNLPRRTENTHVLDIKKVEYLNMVVKETLRLHPPGPLLLPRHTIKDSQLDGYDIPCGTTILVNAWGMGRDVSIWGENAAEFYPERFENLGIDYATANCELPSFGGGRRTCPAIKTAPETIQSVIASLFYWFDWELPGGVKNEDLDMQEVGTLVVGRKLPLYLIATKYNVEDN